MILSPYERLRRFERLDYEEHHRQYARRGAHLLVCDVDSPKGEGGPEVLLEHLGWDIQLIVVAGGTAISDKQLDATGW